ncbi:MAG: aminotransferase class V-fold PLP-dependent enzyme [Patescibacteria group bacterium]|jgi:cysteine desulfurase/selenocysteine lyase
MLFGTRSRQHTETSSFAYLDETQLYFDSACQTLRPQEVIDAEIDYYKNYNACGGRVKYEWGRRVDDAVSIARRRLLDALGKSANEYAVAFTLNTTYGINLVLQQLKVDRFKNIVTSQIEHNSVFLPTITVAKKYGLSRLVLERAADGALSYNKNQLERSVVLVSTTSNVDGRQCVNVADLARDTHAAGGLLFLDAAQSMVYHRSLLANVDFDCLFGSSHKMYGPSLGFIVFKKSLLENLDISFIGGGMVSDVSELAYSLIDEQGELHTRLEPGLQNWAGIIGFSAALEWLSKYRPSNKAIDVHVRELSQTFLDELKTIPAINLVNSSASPVVAFSFPNADAHRLSLMLSEQGVMARSGYFCCHYYLQKVLKLPPLLRLSLGLQNTHADVSRVVKIISSTLQAF